MENPFTEEFQAFLIDRIHSADLSAVSPQYRKTANEIAKFSNSIKPLLSEEARKILTKLDDAQGNQLTIATELAYQKGFAEGVKLILYLFEKE
jgi:hypothetical protein